LSEDNVVFFDKNSEKKHRRKKRKKQKKQKEGREERIDRLLESTGRAAVEHNWTKSMVILLEDSGDTYNTHYIHPDLRYSEAIALLDIVRNSILDDMKL